MLSRKRAATIVEQIARRGALIGGDRVAETSEGRLPHFDPATGEHHADVAMAGPAEVGAAVEAARAAIPVWRGLPLERRIEVLHRLADLVLERRDECNAINALDNGSPVAVLDSVRPVLRRLGRQARWSHRAPLRGGHL
jgi:acyl-CoA reductase-like NAD-dependent aldehyde dehydrogenase